MRFASCRWWSQEGRLHGLDSATYVPHREIRPLRPRVPSSTATRMSESCSNRARHARTPVLPPRSHFMKSFHVGCLFLLVACGGSEFAASDDAGKGGASTSTSTATSTASTGGDTTGVTTGGPGTSVATTGQGGGTTVATGAGGAGGGRPDAGPGGGGGQSVDAHADAPVSCDAGASGSVMFHMGADGGV